MSDEIHSGQETTAGVKLCPECGSAATESDAGAPLLDMDSYPTKCLACGWSGDNRELLTQKFQHEMGSDDKLMATMVEDMRNILAQDLAKALGRFLMKWGFIGVGVTPKELSRYVVAAAQAVLKSVIETRREIEQEKS